MDTIYKATRRAVEAAGGGTRLAEHLPIGRHAIYMWRRVPPEHVLTVERISGVSRHELRPDIYGPAPEEETAA